MDGSCEEAAPEGPGATSLASYNWQPGANGTSTYVAVNSLNQYPSVTPAGSGAVSLAYDGKGNLTGDGTFTYAYDAENRLLSANKSGASNSYAYDPLGRRTTKSASGVVTYFLNDGDDELAEYNSVGALTTRYVPGPAIDEPGARVS